MNRFLPLLCMALFVGFSPATALAQSVIYSDNFDSPIGANGDEYFTDSPSYNGITDGTSSGGITTGASFAGNSNQNGQIITTVTASYGTISAAQSGNYFLYENTTTAFASPVVVWSTAGQTISVTTNTNYTFSFYLNNQDNISVATIQPIINGVDIGSTLSASGVNTWQQFSVTWNSGSATSATFELDNTNQIGDGNDFGIDSIQVAAVPEPRTWAALALLLTIALTTFHRLVQSGRLRWNAGMTCA